MANISQFNVKLNSIYNCACITLHPVYCFKWNIKWSFFFLLISHTAWSLWKYGNQISRLSCQWKFGFIWVFLLWKHQRRRSREIMVLQEKSFLLNKKITAFFFLPPQELHLIIRPPFAVAWIFPPSPCLQYHSRHSVRWERTCRTCYSEGVINPKRQQL